jgi:DNA polymerase-3 subunit beta
MKLQGGSLKLTTTNLEMATSCSVRAKGEREGEITVPVKLFLDFIQLLPDARVDLETDGDTLMIASGNFKTRICGISSSEFPIVPAVAGGRMYTLRLGDMKEAIGRVVFAAAAPDARSELAGASLNLHNPATGRGKATLAATDSFRLAEATFPVQGEAETISPTIPTRAMVELGRILAAIQGGAEEVGELHLTVADNQVMATMGDTSFMTRTIDEPYPDYRQIIPAKFQTHAVFDVGEFLKALKSVGLFSAAKTNDISLECSPEDGFMKVRGEETGRGESSALVGAVVTGVKSHVVLSCRYLIDGLQALTSERGEFQLIDQDHPCVLLPSPQEKMMEYFYIVMPIKQ